MNTIETLLQNYQASPEAAQILVDSRIVLCVGIVAAGKDTIQKQLEQLGDYRRIITCTTRAPRVNSGILEQDGVEYHFFSTQEMQRHIERHEMIEVNKFGDNFYGTHVDEFKTAMQQGKIALGDIDINGIASFRRIAPDAVIALFIVPPNYETWRDRLRKRYTSQDIFDKEWQKRRDITIKELEMALSASYYHFIINDDLDRAVRVIDEIAHRQDSFNRHDDEARLVARDLLDAIRAHAD